MITEAEAVNLFAPIQSELAKIILESWKKIHATDLHFRARSRACLMWDETFDAANLILCDSPHIEHIEEKSSQTAYYWFNENTFFRIKKGDEKGFTCNYPTQTAMGFHDMTSDMFGIVNRLEVTYVLSPDESEITDIAVVHRNGNKIDFRFSLLSRHNVQAIPENTREAATSEAESTTKSIAKLKSKPKENKDIRGV